MDLPKATHRDKSSLLFWLRPIGFPGRVAMGFSLKNEDVVKHLTNLDEICLENLEVRCIVGIFPRERVEPQPLTLRIKLFLDCRRAARESSLSYSVDYGVMAQDVALLLQSSQFKLLETAAEAVAYYLLNWSSLEPEKVDIKAVQVSIEKPKALTGQTFPRVTVLRRKQEVLWQATAGFHLIYNNVDTVIMKTRLEPGAAMQLRNYDGAYVCDVPLGDGFTIGQSRWSTRLGMERQAGEVIPVANCSVRPQILLTIIRRRHESSDLSIQFNNYFCSLDKSAMEFLN